MAIAPTRSGLFQCLLHLIVHLSILRFKLGNYWQGDPDLRKKGDKSNKKCTYMPHAIREWYVQSRMSSLTFYDVHPCGKSPSPSKSPTLGTAGGKSSEFGDMYLICTIYAVEQSIGTRIINGSFTPYTELPPYPDKGSNRCRDMKSLDSELSRPTKLKWMWFQTWNGIFELKGQKTGKGKITQPCWRICNQKSFCRRPRAIHKANIMVNAADSKQRPKRLTGKRIRSELPTNVIFLSILGYSVHGDILMFTVWYILGRQSPSPASDIQLLSRSTFQYSVAFWRG